MHWIKCLCGQFQKIEFKSQNRLYKFKVLEIGESHDLKKKGAFPPNCIKITNRIF